MEIQNVHFAPKTKLSNIFNIWELECVKQILNETISWLSQHGIHITFNEKSFIFGIDPDQKNDINRLVLMENKIVYIL